MKAVIMAGGSGTRLRPLTCSIPKPLAPLCTKPVVEFILDLLNKHKINEGIFTLMYKGSSIEKYFPDYQYKGIDLTFTYEREPLGTAGCVKQAMNNELEDFLVISGDAMCDFDLTSAIEFHKKHNADATIITKKVDDPREYGIINSQNSRVVGFSEKPDFSGCFSDSANTGIYILSPKVLSLIEENKQIDFSNDIFPLMLEKNMKLYAFECEGYWCDIGDFKSYKQCQVDMLEGKVDCEIDGKKFTGSSVIKSHIPSGVTIGKDVYIGTNVKMGENVHIGSNSIIGNNVTIERETKIQGSVILDGVNIADNVTINSAVICANSHLKSGSCVYEDCVVGEDCIIGENVVLNSGVRVWQGKFIPKGTTVMQDVKYGSKGSIRVVENGLYGATNIEITPQISALFGMGAGSLSQTGIAVSCSSDNSSKAMLYSLAGGISATGTRVFNMGQMPLPMLIYGARLAGCDLLIYITGGINSKIHIFSSGGLELTRKQERKLESCILRGEYSKASWLEFGEIKSDYGIADYYTSMLKRQLRKITQYNLIAITQDKKLGMALNTAFSRVSDLSCSDMEIILSDNGTKCTLKHSSVGNVSWEQLVMIALYETFENGHNASVPNYFPTAAEQLAKKFSKKLYRFYVNSTGNEDSIAREMALSQPYLFDGAVLAVCVISYLTKKKISIKDALSLIPEFESAQRFVKINGSSPMILRKLRERSKQYKEGIVIENTQGRVLLKANKLGSGLIMYAEGYAAETAKGLCDDVEKIISELSLDN